MVQRGAEIAPGVGEIRGERHGAAIGVDRLVEALERVQRVAEVAVRQGEIGRERDGAAMAGGGLLVVLALVERGAEIAQRFGIIGLELDRAAAGGDRRVDAAGEPAHLAEIGVEERHVRRDLDRALEMPDRLAEPARLVRDHAEDMQGIGLVRLRLERASAERLGLDEPSGAAVRFGLHEQIGNRHYPHPRSIARLVARMEARGDLTS